MSMISTVGNFLPKKAVVAAGGGGQTALWVAGGLADVNSLAYSTDGTTWVGLNKNTFTQQTYSVAYGKNNLGVVLWIAGGYGTGGNSMAYSTNGITWVGLNKNTFSSYCYCVAYGNDNLGNGLWVAGGNGTGNTLAYSYDGTTWVGLNKNIFSVEVYSVTYGKNASGNGLWLAGGGDAGATGNSIAYSTNGITWVGIQKNTPTNTFYSVTFISYGKDGSGKGLWRAGGNGEGNSNAYSTDGINWIGTGFSPFIGSCATYGKNNLSNGLWVAGGYTNVVSGANTMAYSTNGTIWTGLQKNTFTDQCSAIAYGKGDLGIGLWVAGGTGTGNTLAYSTDGTTWTGLGISTINNRVNSIAYADPSFGILQIPSQWVAVGYAGLIAKSTDGNVWTPVNSDFDGSKGGITNYGYGVAYGIGALGAGLWVAVGFGGLIAKSTDGTNWTPAATVSGVSGKGGITSYGYGVAYGKDGNGVGLWVAVGMGGLIAKSTDGNVWTPAYTSVAGNVGGLTTYGYGVAYGKDGNGVGLWVAVGQGGLIAKSTDGNIWTPAAGSGTNKGGITDNGRGVAYGKDGTGAGLWVAVGDGGLIAKSTDGNVWTPTAFVDGVNGKGGITGAGRGVAYGKDALGAGLWVAVGFDGLIAKSSDGNVWTPAATVSGVSGKGGITTYAYGVAYGKDALGAGLWVAVGQGGVIAKSTDGNVWTPAATSADGSKGGITSPGLGVAFNEILYLRT